MGYEDRYERIFDDMDRLYEEIEMSEALIDYYNAHEKEKDAMLDWMQATKWWADWCDKYASEEEDYDPRDR